MLPYCIYPSQVIAKRFLFSRAPLVFLPLRVRFYLFTCIPHVILPFASAFRTNCYPLAQLTTRLRFTFTALARYDADNIYESKYKQTMNNKTMTEQQFNDQYGPDALNLAIELGFDRDELLQY